VSEFLVDWYGLVWTETIELILAMYFPPSYQRNLSCPTKSFVSLVSARVALKQLAFSLKNEKET
jgi:hypothetical protein